MDEKRNLGLVVIINGKGGCGKDTLISGFAEKDNDTTVMNVSSITPVVDFLKSIGIDPSNKNLGMRKRMAYLKNEFNKDGKILEYLDLTHDSFTRMEFNTSRKVMFIHIREPEQIKFYYDRYNNKPYKVITLLVTSERTENVTYGNPSDDEVNDYQYDYTISNNDINRAIGSLSFIINSEFKRIK